MIQQDLWLSHLARPLKMLFGVATLLASFGCIKNPFKIGASSDFVPFSIKVEGFESSKQLTINEGSSLNFTIHLDSPCGQDTCSMALHLVGSEGEAASDYWAASESVIEVQKGSSSASFKLNSIDENVSHTNTFWTLDLGGGVSSADSRVFIILLNNDLVGGSLPVTYDAGNEPLSATLSLSSSESPDLTFCSGTFAFTLSSKNEVEGEYHLLVDTQHSICRYHIVTKGAGGGASQAGRLGGSGGANEILFYPNQSGEFIIVIGEAGALTPGDDGAPGGGASSVFFDPAGQPSREDWFGLTVAGGGGGAGNGRGGNGGGNFAGADGVGDGKGAPGNGLGGASIDLVGGSCMGQCQGGAGGGSYDATVSSNVGGGFGKGSGSGRGYSYYGGGGGGGFGAGGASRWAGGGGGGAGKVYVPNFPSVLSDITMGTGQGLGGRGGSVGVNSADDGSVTVVISPP